MKLTRDDVHVWVYHPTEKDSPTTGEFHGWCERKNAFKHYRCEQYFSKLGEKHSCKMWSKDFLKKMDSYMVESKSHHGKVL